jgi:transcriptional regulator with XRE-family HTH domain
MVHSIPGHILQQFRESKGWSRQFISDRTTVRVSTIWKWEKSDKAPVLYAYALAAIANNITPISEPSSTLLSDQGRQPADSEPCDQAITGRPHVKRSVPPEHLNKRQPSIPAEGKELLNVKEAAEFIGISRVTMYRLIERWKLKPKMYVGNIPLYSLKDIRQMKEKMAAGTH